MINDKSKELPGEAALERLFRQAYPLIFNYAKKLLCDHHAAEDAVQDAFCKIAPYAEQWESGAHARAYCFKAVYTICMDKLKAAKKEGHPLVGENEEQIRDHGYDPVGQILRVEMYEAVGEAMEELPPARREVIWLTWFEDKPLEEVAILLGKSYDATKALKHAARKQICEILITKYHFRPDLLYLVGLCFHLNG